MEKIKIIVTASNREWAVTCSNLDDVASAIDDFSTDHCEGSCQLYMKFDGNGNLYPVNIFRERGVLNDLSGLCYS